MKIDDILIIGDSFCEYRDSNGHWPYDLVSKLTNKSNLKYVRGKGFPGAHWWSVLTLLKQELQKRVPKILILCHTDCIRFPLNGDLPANPSSAFEPDLNHLLPKKIRKALIYYYTYLRNEDFDIWSRNQYFLDIDRIINNYNIEKVIHLHCFRDNCSYVFKNGITVNTPLVDISTNEIIARQIPTLDNRLNHMNEFNNQQFSFFIEFLLKNYQDGVSCGINYNFLDLKAKKF